jgi:hypothetical protein
MIFVLLLVFGLAASKAVDIDCKFVFQTSLCLGGTFYTCLVKNVQLGDENFLKINEDHMSGKNNSDVETFNSNQKNFTSIPKEIGESFPNLKVVSFENSGLSSVSAEDLKQFKNVKSLIFFRNELKIIKSDLFTFTPDITCVNFRDNKIEHIGQNLLMGLEQLIFVDFEENPCIQMIASNRSEVLDLAAKLSVNCPPVAQQQTQGMIDQLAKGLNDLAEIWIYAGIGAIGLVVILVISCFCYSRRR